MGVAVIQWPLVLLSLLAGTGGVLTASAGLAELSGRAREGRLAALIAAAVLIVAGGLCGAWRLARPQYVMAAATNVFSFSGLSIEMVAMGLAIVVAIAYAVAIVREASTRVLKVFAVLGVVVGLVMAFSTGQSFVVGGRPLWNTELLPLAYLGSVLPVGGFLYVGIAKVVGAGQEDLAKASPLLIVAAVLSAASMVAYLLFLGDAAASDPLAANVAVGLCGVCGVIACSLVAFAVRHKAAWLPIVCLAVVLAVVGGVGIRCVMWEANIPYVSSWNINDGFLSIAAER